TMPRSRPPSLRARCPPRSGDPCHGASGTRFWSQLGNDRDEGVSSEGPHVDTRCQSDPTKGNSMGPDDRYIVISADTHAGGSHAQYREYLDEQYKADFDAWREKYKNPFKDLKDTDQRVRNWD